MKKFIGKIWNPDLYTGVLIATAAICILLLMEISLASRNVKNTAKVLNQWSEKTPALSEDLTAEMIDTTLERIAIYEDQVQQRHLVSGMVINRGQLGEILDKCDSLLFSSLRYIALKKLGQENKAHQAWQAIAKSRDGGNWHRHPACAKQSTSRDMILGLLAALTQQPEGTPLILEELLEVIDENNGYFSSGPFYVSYLSPGLGKVLNHLALTHGISTSKIPEEVQQGFSTSELDALTTQRGYQSHLIALNSWIEMEILKNNPKRKTEWQQQNLLSQLNTFNALFHDVSLINQRLPLITTKLSLIDTENLFFLWLRLKSAGLDSKANRMRLLSRLLSMPQFPHARLPKNCDRKADYLWQRDSKEYVAFQDQCTMTFNGVDFIWLASMLLDSQHGNLAQKEQ